MLLHESEVKPHIQCTNNSRLSFQPAISSNKTFWWEGRPPIAIQQSSEQKYDKIIPHMAKCSRRKTFDVFMLFSLNSGSFPTNYGLVDWKYKSTSMLLQVFQWITIFHSKCEVFLLKCFVVYSITLSIWHKTNEIQTHDTAILSSGLLCSKIYLLCFWALLKKIAHYAQNYAHKIQLCSCSIVLISVCYSTSTTH